MNQKIKLGIIGLGNHFYENLLPSIQIINSFEIVAVSSRSDDKLTDFKQNYESVTTSNSWQDIINNSNVDAVLVAATPDIHYQVARECLIQNKHIFVEKPPAINLLQIQELAELETNSSAKSFVGYNFSFSQSYNLLLQSLNNHEIKTGKFRFIVGKMNRPMDGFESVLDTVLYKALIHPLHTLYYTFGKIRKVNLIESIFEDNRFSLQLFFEFENGSRAYLDTGNYSNRFECDFELVNKAGETGKLKNLFEIELAGKQDCNFDKKYFKNKERLSYNYSPVHSGFDRSGYKPELEAWIASLIDNTNSKSSLKDSLYLYGVIAQIKKFSEIKF